MNPTKDEAFILSLHVACQGAEQKGFHHTRQALLGMLAREVGHTDATGVQQPTVRGRSEEPRRCRDAQLLECQYG
jgi:hypothetical protein